MITISFTKLVQMSLIAGIMILAVWLVRLLFHRMPKAFVCLLWCLVGVRLICPISLESRFSLLPKSLVELQESDITESSLQKAIGLQGNSSIAGTLPEENTSAQDIFTTSPSIQPVDIVADVWLVGMVIMLIYSIFSYMRLKRRISDAVLLHLPEIDGQKDTERNLYQSEKVDSPFVLGILQPRIYLPYALEEESRSCIIVHERAHIRRGDHLLKPLAFFILAVYWFQPLVWLWFVLLCKDMELACDELVMKEMDFARRKTYAEVLLSCSSGHTRLTPSPLAFGEVGVRTRIKNALHYKKPAFWVLVLSVIICVVVGLCFMTKPEKEPEDTKMLEWLNSKGITEGWAIRSEEGFQIRTGEIYKYCHLLRGTNHNAVKESLLLVYTDEPEVTFEKAGKRLFSSQLFNYPRMYVVLLGELAEAEEREYNTSSDIFMTLSDITADGATVKIHNESNIGAEYGSYYEVQIWFDDAWRKLPTRFENYAWHQVAYNIEGNLVRTEEIQWALHGTLPEGKYRFVKSITQSRQEHWMAVEFTVESAAKP